MKVNFKFHSLILLLFLAVVSNAQAVQKSKKSVVPSAEEMKAMAQKSEEGFKAIANLVDAIDLSFLKEIDPSIKDEDITLSEEDKKEMKAKIMEGSKSLQEIDFKKLETALLQLEDAMKDFDPEVLFNAKPKKDKKE